MHFLSIIMDMVVALAWHRRLLVFGDLYNEEYHLSRSTICLGTHVYMHYDYVHLNNLSDISAYRTVVKQQRHIHRFFNHEQ